MYSVAVGIRPYGQLVEHYEENMLSQINLLHFFFFELCSRESLAPPEKREPESESKLITFD